VRLGIDIDGTIKYTHRAAIEIYNRVLKRNIKEEEVTTYLLDEPYGLDGEEGRALWRRLEAEIYQIGKPLEYSADSLKRLEQEGFEIVYITARPNGKIVQEITEEWLFKNDFPFADRLFMNSQDKAKIALEQEIEMFFEDDPMHVQNLVANGIHTVVMDWPYNRVLPNEIPRIKDWIEGFNYVMRWQNGRGREHEKS
jgi:uncharacterized HAD superfamily protein